METRSSKWTLEKNPHLTKQDLGLPPFPIHKSPLSADGQCRLRPALSWQPAPPWPPPLGEEITPLGNVLLSVGPSQAFTQPGSAHGFGQRQPHTGPLMLMPSWGLGAVDTLNIPQPRGSRGQRTGPLTQG